MSIVKKYVNVHPDVLIEWIYDADNFVASDYTVVADGLNGKRSFALSYDGTVAPEDIDGNRAERQLFQLDSITNRWGVADPAQRMYIQHEDHISPAPSRFDRVRVYFPINYTFNGSLGFYLGISAYDYDNQQLFGLANYFLDSSNLQHQGDIKFLSPPWQFQERLWGKVVDILVPSVYDQSRERTGYPAKPTPGTINYNLTGGFNGNGLSQTAPIIVDFRFIDKRETVLGMHVYTLPPAVTASFPQTPEYQTLGVAIEQAEDGDYFELFGTFNGNTADFDDFMYALAESGQRNQVLFTVTVFEENLAQDPITFRMVDTFNRKIPFCPVLKFTNTTASIAVSMAIIDEVDGSSEVRNAEIGLLPNEVSKYGRSRLAINVANAIKPKVYVARPEQIILGKDSGAIGTSRRVQTQNNTVIKFKPYPLLTESFNVVSADISSTSQDIVYHGKGLLNIRLHPFDNAIKFRLAREVSPLSYAPFTLDAAADTMQLSFTTTGRTLTIDLYQETQELDTKNGVYIYMVREADVRILSTMVQENDNFYLILVAGGTRTVAYHGKYGLSGLDKPVKKLPDSEPVVIAPPVLLEAEIIKETATPIVVTPPVVATPGTGTTTPPVIPMEPTNDTPAADAPVDDNTYGGFYGGGYSGGGGGGSRWDENRTGGPYMVDYALIN